MKISKEEIINYIKVKKVEREKSLLGVELSAYEQDMQNNMFLGVDMVIKWINEIHGEGMPPLE